MAHLKLQDAPKTWILNNNGRFVTRSHPSASREFSVPLNLLLKNVLGEAKTTREVKYYLNNNIVKLNGVKVNDPKTGVILMSLLSINEKNYRVVFSKTGKLVIEEVKDKSNLRSLKVKSLTYLKGGNLQINLYFGENILILKDKVKNFIEHVKIDDTIVVENNKIIGYVKLDKGSNSFIFGGKNRGLHGVIDGFEKELVKIKDIEGNEILVVKNHVYPIPKDYTKDYVALK